MRRITAWLPLLLIIAGGYPAAGQSTDNPVREIKLTLSPMGEPRPALKYMLLPPLVEQTAGDGMAAYMSAMDGFEQAFKDSDLSDKVTDWIDTPAEKMDWSDVRSVVDRFSSQLSQVDAAARYKSSQWNLPFDTQGIDMKLPALSHWRFVAKIISGRTRLAEHEGRFDDAVRSMQTMVAMARHVSDGPTLIQSLVGTAIGAICMKDAQQFLSTPNAPNLYWALSSVPDPLIAMSNPIQGESYMVLGTFPELKEGMNAKLSPAQWNALLRKVVKTLTTAMGGQTDGRDDAMILEVIRTYTQAKQYFREQGMTQQEVEAMPVGKAVLMYTMREYEVQRDNIFKWWSVPFWQAWPHMQKSDAQIVEASQAGKGGPFLMLLPSLGRARASLAGLDKTIAILRAIEAIRIYAAGHNGQLPGSLDDFGEVPVPLNPLTGKPFSYRLEGEAAVLEAPAVEGLSGQEGQRYILTIRK